MDLIERQAAIDALQKEINKGIPPFDDVIGSIRCGVRLARNIIEDLPSAEPNLQPTCSQLATDCISRQGAIDVVNELTRWYYETFHEKRPTAYAVIDKLMDLPSVEPEIIRCKDCKYFEQYTDDGTFESVLKMHQWDGECSEWVGHTYMGWFCSRAERKEDE